MESISKKETLRISTTLANRFFVGTIPKREESLKLPTSSADLPSMESVSVLCSCSSYEDLNMQIQEHKSKVPLIIFRVECDKCGKTESGNNRRKEGDDPLTAVTHACGGCLAAVELHEFDPSHTEFPANGFQVVALAGMCKKHEASTSCSKGARVGDDETLRKGLAPYVAAVLSKTLSMQRGRKEGGEWVRRMSVMMGALEGSFKDVYEAAKELGLW